MKFENPGIEAARARAATDEDKTPIPLRDYVLIRKEEQRASAGGLVLPAGSSEHTYAIVVAVGPGRFVDGVWVATELKPGDRLLFDSERLGNVQVFRWHGKAYGMVREEHVGGILPGPLPEPSLIAAPGGSVDSDAAGGGIVTLQ